MRNVVEIMEKNGGRLGVIALAVVLLAPVGLLAASGASAPHIGPDLEGQATQVVHAGMGGSLDTFEAGYAEPGDTWTARVAGGTVRPLMEATGNSCPKGGNLTVAAGGSIQAAVDAASPGDTIKVMPGVYNESVVIDTECLTLKGGYGGEAASWAILDGTGAGVNGFTVRADHTKIQGFEIRNFLAGGIDEGSGVQAACGGPDFDCGIRPNYGIVRGNLIHHNFYAGVVAGAYGLPGITGWKIENNEVDATSGEWAGIRLYSCSDCRVTDNVVTVAAGSYAGIAAEAHNDFAGDLVTSGVHIKDNNVSGPSDFGILVDSVAHLFDGNSSRMTDVQVEGNVVQGASFSNIFSRGRRGAQATDHVKVEDNISLDAGYFGIDFQLVSDSVMEDNTSSGSARANFIFITSSNGNRMEGNLSLDSGFRGLVVVSGSYNNVLEGNTVRRSGWDGIWLRADDNRVEGNVVEDSGVLLPGLGNGITVVRSSGNRVIENVVSGSPTGCDFLYSGGPDNFNCWEDNSGTECPDPLPVCD